MKGGGAEGAEAQMGRGEALKSIRGKGLWFLRVERGRKIAIDCYTNCIHNGLNSISTSRPGV